MKVPNRPRCKNLCGKAKQRGVLKIITHGFVTGFVILMGSISLIPAGYLVNDTGYSQSIITNLEIRNYLSKRLLKVRFSFMLTVKLIMK